MNDMHGSRNLELEGLRSFPLARRGIIMTTLMSGLTLATTRVEAQAITTDTDGLEVGEVQIPTADGKLPAYYARPKGAGPFPVVLVIEEIFGVHDYIKDICRRFAKEGYMAVATEYYARIGDLSKMTDVGEIFAKVISKAPDATMMADLDATAAWAFANHGNAAKLAVTGFCRGGRATWLYAEHNPKLKAAAAWYGHVNTPASDIQPHSAMEMAAELKCPMLGLYGGKDTGIKVEDVLATAAKARAAGQEVEIRIFPEAGHAFHADYRPSYRADAALAGWTQTLAWFRSHGVG